MGKGDSPYWAAHLGQDHWNNIPAESGLWNSYNHKPDRRKWKKIYSKILPMLKRILSQYLTPRQFEVMKLCLYEPHYTQSATAHLLGISQPTVSQHLNGKRRDGKKVGGACRRIRRRIRTIMVSQDWSVEERPYLDFLHTLTRSDLSYRQRQQIFRTLL